ncbi:MAG: hypothetical protein H7328_04720 [Bdellovibrio sp.]|nr:hypothetical protein [Bdellovibrio sp.]
MKKSAFGKWLSHPTYFMFWIALGFYAWSFSFNSKDVPVQGDVQMSSLAETDVSADFSEDVMQTEYKDLEAKSDEQIIAELEASSEKYDFSKDENPYAVDPQALDEFDEKMASAPYKVKDNYFVYENILDGDIKVDFEEAKACGAPRLIYEKMITSNPKLKSWIQLPEKEDADLPMKCITHIMNSVTLPKANYALCAKASGGGRRGIAKSCVTQNMVSLTYNAYTDVTDCLNLNPKDLLPKISNESGFALNAYGTKGDGGIGQLTGIAIAEVNKVYDNYLTQIQKAAATKPSCARIMQDKSVLTKASAEPSQRCSLMAVPENPLKNVLYMAILNRMNMDRMSGISFLAGKDYLSKDGEWKLIKNNSSDSFEGVFKKYQFKAKLEKLGIKNANLHFYKDVLTFAGYNMGTPTSIRLFDEYLSKRLGLRKITKSEKAEKVKAEEDNASPYLFNEQEVLAKPIKTSLKDFDFNNTAVAYDVDEKEKSVVTIARLQVNSGSISKKDAPVVKAQKVKRRKELPKQWALAHLKTFPEYLAYRANNYDGKSTSHFTMYGTPGYLNLVADKNKSMRDLFNASGSSPDYCSNPNFLKANK